MRGQVQKAAEEEAQIDLTPMLDVVFIMLIFFSPRQPRCLSLTSSLSIGVSYPARVTFFARP